MNDIQKYYNVGGALALEKVASIISPTLIGAGIGSGAGALFGDDALSGAAKGALIGGGIGLGSGLGAIPGTRLSDEVFAKRIAEGKTGGMSPDLRHALYVLTGAVPGGIIGGAASSRLYNAATD